MPPSKRPPSKASHSDFDPGKDMFNIEFDRNGMLLLERIQANTSAPTRAWETLAVWFVVCKSGLSWNRNTTVCSAEHIADLCGFRSLRTVDNAIETLAHVGALRVLPRKPHHRKLTLWLNPDLVWRGTPGERETAAKDFHTSRH